MQSTIKKTIVPGSKAAIAAAIAMSLAACGGGSSGPGEQPGSVTITGTAATVVAGTVPTAMGGAAVVATCARGDGTSMTNADGSFSVTVSKPGVAPCVLQVFKADYTSLRSIAPANGNYNITPMTELLVQYISAQISTAALPVSTSTTNSGNILSGNAAYVKLVTTPELLNKSIARVSEYAKTYPAPATPGLAVPADFLTGQLVTRTASSAGNAQNAFLEALRARNTITATGTLSATTSAEALKDAALPANKVSAP